MLTPVAFTFLDFCVVLIRGKTMATASQVTTLIRAFKENDRDRFISTAIQLAAHETKLGHGTVALEIRQLVDAIKGQPLHAKVLSFKDNAAAEISDLVIVSHPEERLPEAILPSRVLSQIERLLLEYKQRAKLHAHGMLPRRKSLLAGPPGTGKTMTARILAGELHLPLYTVLMDKLVTKFMGETSAKLRQIFSHMIQHRGVYLFDEFDAIGGERTRANDVGEMRRVLNTFLQLLEQDASESIIVAATNEATILDAALFRRFDDVLYYASPDRATIEQLLPNKLGFFWRPPECMDSVVNAAEGLSHAEISEACADAMKNNILHDKTAVQQDDLVAALLARKAKYAR